MSIDKLATIAEKLLEQSRLGQVGWSDTADEDRFSAVYPEHSVTISSELRERPVASAFLDPISFRPPRTERYRVYGLAVHDGLGREVESVAVNDREDNYQAFEELFQLARRKALKTDEVLDDLLERLSAQG